MLISLLALSLSLNKKVFFFVTTTTTKNSLSRSKNAGNKTMWEKNGRNFTLNTFFSNVPERIHKIHNYLLINKCCCIALISMNYYLPLKIQFKTLKIVLFCFYDLFFELTIKDVIFSQISKWIENSGKRK